LSTQAHRRQPPSINDPKDPIPMTPRTALHLSATLSAARLCGSVAPAGFGISSYWPEFVDVTTKRQMNRSARHLEVRTT
jgi:hypothetical protein